MTRLATSLGTLMALLAVAPSAQAGSYSFSIGGHRFHVEAPRNCRSASCVSISANRSLRPTEDYYARMTLKSPGKLYVEACALGHFRCSGNDWTRVEEPQEQVVTTSRQWSARS